MSKTRGETGQNEEGGGSEAAPTIPGQSILGSRLGSPQSTPHNPEHSPHTSYSLYSSPQNSQVAAGGTHTRARVRARTRTYVQPRECRPHYAASSQTGYPASAKQVSFVLTGLYWAVQRKHVGRRPSVAGGASAISSKTHQQVRDKLRLSLNKPYGDSNRLSCLENPFSAFLWLCIYNCGLYHTIPLRNC